MEVQPNDIQQVGDQLAFKWPDGLESFISLEDLRRHCPCAGCKGEVDIMGNVYGGESLPLSARAFQLVSITRIGSYALQPLWADGHSSGLYSFELLRVLCESNGGRQ